MNLNHRLSLASPSLTVRDVDLDKDVVVVRMPQGSDVHS